MDIKEIKEISETLNSFSSKAERRSKLFELKRNGINIHDVACAFLMGPIEVQDHKMGFYILKSFIKNEVSKAEQIYCLLKGIGVRKNQPQAYTELESFIQLNNNFLDLKLFESPYTESMLLKDIYQDKDYKKIKFKINQTRAEIRRRENKLKKLRIPIIIFFEIIPILILLSYPFWATLL